MEIRTHFGSPIFRMRSLPNELPVCDGSANLSLPATDSSPKHMARGCPPDIVSSSPNITSRTSGIVWFLMRVAYGREEKARQVLEADGIETFLPTITRVRLVNGNKKHIVESLTPNFLFVRSDERTMRRYCGQPPLTFLHHYYVPYRDDNGNPIGVKGIKPLIIPDCQMDQFRRWHNVNDDHKLFVSDTYHKLKMGDHVRIIEGKFAGITGFVCRHKKQTRVGVHINGWGTVLTAYIPREFLQAID